MDQKTAQISAEVAKIVKDELVERAEREKRSIQKQLEYDLEHHPEYDVGGDGAGV